MDLGIQGKVAIVTGGSRGLGREAALSLAREGCNLCICARGEDRLKQTQVELELMGIKAVALAADVTLSSDAKRIYEAASSLGPVEILINNAGGSYGGRDIDSVTDEDMHQVLELNLHGAMRLAKLVIPKMKEVGWGRIINISSIYGREHGGGIGYMVGKAALIALTKHMALSLAKDRILVNTIAPGSIQFPGGGWDNFLKNQDEEVVQKFIRSNLPMGRFGWPEPFGDLVAYLSSDRIGFLTGSCINIDGGQGKSLI